jgi:monovalent cation/proton antiporter MnhG/PhaG subunit
MTTLAGALSLLGALIVLLAAVALHRFDAVMTRLHTAGKATTLGIVLVLGGVALAERDATSPRLLLAAGLYLITVAAAIGLLARAIHTSDPHPTRPVRTSNPLSGPGDGDAHEADQTSPAD